MCPDLPVPSLATLTHPGNHLHILIRKASRYSHSYAISLVHPPSTSISFISTTYHTASLLPSQRHQQPQPRASSNHQHLFHLPNLPQQHPFIISSFNQSTHCCSLQPPAAAFSSPKPIIHHSLHPLTHSPTLHRRVLNNHQAISKPSPGRPNHCYCLHVNSRSVSLT